MTSKKTPVKATVKYTRAQKAEPTLTLAQLRRLIAKERKIWEDDRALIQDLRNQQIEMAKYNGRCLTSADRHHAHEQATCTHKKAGTIRDLKHPRAEFLRGNGLQYAVLKHKFSHGDIWVRCLRCGKWWKPPIRSQYKLDRDFWRAMFDYEEAVNFPTNNIMSESIQLRFDQFNSKGGRVDGVEIVREKLANAAGY